jgi:hypothetical protein
MRIIRTAVFRILSDPYREETLSYSGIHAHRYRDDISTEFTGTSFSSRQLSAWLSTHRDWRIGVQFRSGTDFSLKTSNEASPTSYAMDIGVYLPVNKWPGRDGDHSPPSSAQDENAWSYTSVQPYALLPWYFTELHPPPVSPPLPSFFLILYLFSFFTFFFITALLLFLQLNCNYYYYYDYFYYYYYYYYYKGKNVTLSL